MNIKDEKFNLLYVQVKPRFRFLSFLPNRWPFRWLWKVENGYILQDCCISHVGPEPSPVPIQDMEFTNSTEEDDYNKQSPIIQNFMNEWMKEVKTDEGVSESTPE